MAREKVVSVFIDEDREFSVNSDHSLLLVNYECNLGGTKGKVQRQAK